MKKRKETKKTNSKEPEKQRDAGKQRKGSSEIGEKQNIFGWERKRTAKSEKEKEVHALQT